MLGKIINLPEVYRYVIAGSFAFSVDLVSLMILVDVFGLHYLYSNVISYSIGLIVVYLLNIKWVFAVRKFNRVQIEFSIFAVIALSGLLLSELLMWVTVEKYELQYLGAKIVATAMVFIFNYLVRKITLFS